jgi:polyisoprenyl-phosphate glycosyltransferase
MTNNSLFKLSIVIPFLNESKIIDSLFSELLNVLHTHNYNYRVICVDNNSRDSTLDQLYKYQTRIKNIDIVSFSQYFGKEAAIQAGLNIADGDCCVIMDPDLEDPPECIPKFIEKWKEGFEIVFAKRSNKINIWNPKSLLNFLFYHFFNLISDVKIPNQTGDFRLLDKKVYSVLNQLPEKTRFMRGLCSWLGFKTTFITFHRPTRKKGKSKSNYRFLWIYSLNALFSSTIRPLQIWSYFGFFISIVSFLFGLYILCSVLFFGDVIPGYASTIIIVSFLGGIQLLSFGIMSEYIGRIYIEVKNRPLFIVNKKEGNHDKKKHL